MSWYNQEFFTERNSAGEGFMHKWIYQQIGVLLEEITIQHFLAAEAATFTAQHEVAAVN
ncbi:hypothetical protein [Actinoplanes sp. NPDC049802]|uniref:hypothetical protein n=1 Tax=Actinoplanes sp. NPDC049802 TaxID=3154742 RepID=UPI0033FA7F10